MQCGGTNKRVSAAISTRHKSWRLGQRGTTTRETKRVTHQGHGHMPACGLVYVSSRCCVPRKSNEHGGVIKSSRRPSPPLLWKKWRRVKCRVSSGCDGEEDVFMHTPQGQQHDAHHQHHHDPHHHLIVCVRPRHFDKGHASHAKRRARGVGEEDQARRRQRFGFTGTTSSASTYLQPGPYTPHAPGTWVERGEGGW